MAYGFINNNSISSSSNGGRGIFIDVNSDRTNVTSNSITMSGVSSGVYGYRGVNVLIDCAGKIINGSNTASSYGVYVNYDNYTVKNCIVDRFSTGVYVNEAEYAVLNNNTIYASYSGGYGMRVYGASSVSNSLINNTVIASGNSHGINIGNGRFNTIDCGGKSIIGSNDANRYGVLINTRETILKNCVISNFTISLVFSSSWPGTSYDGIVFNNTFIPNDAKSNDLVELSAVSGNNLFYWNNFTNTSGSYVKDLNGTNKFNTTIGSSGEGNIWFNILNGSVNVSGSVNSSISGLYIGGSGTGYPYNSSNSESKVSADVVDYAPLTNNSNVSGASSLSCGIISACSYILNTNLTSSGDCFTISTSDVNIDCNGYTIFGDNSSGSKGVYSTSGDLIIKNCNFVNFSSSIVLEAITNAQFINFTVTSTFATGRGL